MKDQLQNATSINQIDEEIANNFENVNDQFFHIESQKSIIKHKDKKRNDEDIQKSFKKIDFAKTFKRFNRANQKKIIMHVVKFWKVSKENKIDSIEFQEEMLSIKHIIKYLNSLIRFIITENVKLEFVVKSLSTKFKKSDINTKIVKIYVEIVKNIVFNKIWRKTKFYKKIAKFNVYLQLLNKKFNRKVDWTIHDEIYDDTSKFHYIDQYESRIDEENIWFCQKMLKKKHRTKTAKNAARRHVTWKVQAHTTYKDDCWRYVKQRMLWKFNLVQETLKTSEITWSKNLEWSEILVLTNSSTISIMKNYRSSVKMKKILKNKNHPQISKSDFEKNAKSSKNSVNSSDDEEDDENDKGQ